ncbi:class I SAM-dependent DNA methyltransferase [Candidatus Pelagibacter ubique]|nr:class I SAM-dependent DNA methyltransferase [Candidatus Pelagibacter ubique]
MTEEQKFSQQVRTLIDDLKSVCANYGLGNDSSEFKIITQVFLYKFLHDKFVYEVKLIDKKLQQDSDWEERLASYSKDEFEMLTLKLSEDTAVIKSEQLISSLFARQNEGNFADTFDKTLLDIARENNDIFSVITSGGEKVALFENISKYVSDNRDDFCKAIINKLIGFSFENVFDEGFDFFASIFEYLIKDYNSDSGGKYAEYFTPHSVSRIMAKCLVSDTEKGSVSNVSCYDPSAGSGTLLMNIAHQIGEDKCTIYSQDISQKSSNLLRLNFILNKLVHSIHNVIQGNTLVKPVHKERSGRLTTFDYVVANPPFKLDFSDFRDELDKRENIDRFFAGIPKVPAKKKESMSIYLVFLQHIIFSLKPKGKAAVVVPTGFIAAQSGIEKKIRQKLVDEKMLRGVISMPTNIFASTGTSVSILFIDKTNKEDVVLIDASNLGKKVKEGKNQKTLLTKNDQSQIINTFNDKEVIDNFSAVVSYQNIQANNYSLSAGQYFDFKIKYSDITQKEFSEKIDAFKVNLKSFSTKSEELHSKIVKSLKFLNYDKF